MMERKTLAETMAEELREAILAEVWAAEEALPTEPELAERFGVSRAVVRDATRLITAWGLVEPKQGKGVFVNGNVHEGFSEALLLALRRLNGTALDVELVEAELLPLAATLAAERAKNIDFPHLRHLLGEYEMALTGQTRKNTAGVGLSDAAASAFARLIDAFYAESGNSLLSILGPAVARVRAPRHFKDSPGVPPAAEVRREIEQIGSIIDAVESGHPERARRLLRGNLLDNPEVRLSLEQTPVGDVPKIPISLADLED